MTTKSLQTAERDFGVECREAFARLAAEHAAINPDEPGHRIENQRLRVRKHVAIDSTLDQYADWLQLQSVLTD